jgi:outer membrane receptor protein involved in Fe transport
MVNAGDGELKGVEFYFDKQLTFLPDPFKGLGISMNFTIMDSEVELLRPERREITTSSGEVIPLDPTVTLFQQPDKLANASLYYKSNRFLVRLSYNYRGESLQNVLVSESILEDLVDDIGLGPDALDTFQSAQERWDLFIEYKWKRFSVFLEITNLTNEPLENHYGDSSRLAFVRYTQRVSFIGLQWSL